MPEIMTVVMPSALKERAKDLRINISEVCRDALTSEVQKKEKETGATAAKQVSPATTTCKGGADVS